MVHFWDFNSWGFFNLTALLLASLLGANMLKRSFRWLEATLIPTSVLGGGILLLVSVIYNNITGTEFFDTPFFGGKGTAWLELLKETATVRLYGDRITVDDQEFPFETLGAVVVLGKNKLNLYAGNDVLQLKGDKRFNALKYVNFFHHYKHWKAGNTNGQFLGL